MDILILLLFLVSIVHTILSACPEHVFLPCLLRLKAQRVPMERNMLSVVFSIGTEARLLHTCKVYSSTLPCFREKILECGDDKQRRMLNDVGKMLMFLCSPFSMQQQRSVIRHQECISSIIQMPSALQCQLNSFPEGRQVLQCKKNCAGRNSDFICLMRTWISEQNICTLKDINDKCGADAAALYRELQQTVFEPMFPIICEYDIPETTSLTPTTLATKPTKSSTISAKTKAPTKTKPDEYHKIVTTKEVRINLLFKFIHCIFTDQYNEHHFATVDFVISDSKSHYLSSNSSTKECYENEEGEINNEAQEDHIRAFNIDDCSNDDAARDGFLPTNSSNDFGQ
ncbi:hypothetical protein WR25_23306 [Diploscapter pachys]|uniref:Chondroitin proteoglycan 4 domain-containing protein n=1 Tax=Diploscapter pachys TaxID=2018661 RepID=A0A2A2J7B7_9BILA|nr:hypothetical protein WR25_23306 [Diploscapter pachys]